MMSLLTPAVLLTQRSHTLVLSVSTPLGLVTTTFESSTLKDERLKLVSQREVNGRLRLTLGAGRLLYLIQIFLATGTVQFQTMVLPSTDSVDSLPGTYLRKY
ncbi:NSs protein [Main Drain virus]|uniref:Non-structural protein NS-S n=2 Tax=Orthobunyavirus kernense TaxID=3052405 RepID=Q65659_9VIRU|nr:NSs protein [Main Drain virus]YP_010839444.1 NSs protein [Main Drain virus]AXN72390.1 nonstructural protein NSs [Lokern virus]AXP32033.1 NSs protein [Main Drain virus]CAA51854.1 NSs protein [Main Drain virus]